MKFKKTITRNLYILILNQHFIKNRERLSRLEEDIISYRANFELCVDIYFKG